MMRVFVTALTRSAAAALVCFAAALSGCNHTGGMTAQQIFENLSEKFSGPSGKELAVQMFDSKDADVRRQAVDQIAAHKNLHREPYLHACAVMVKDPDPTVRSAALRALAAGGGTKYIPEVAAALSNDPNALCRRDAAAALDRLVGKAAVAPLIAAAHTDDDVAVRSAAAYALRHYPSKKVLHALLVCLNDSRFAVRFRAAQALRQLTGLEAGTDPAAWRAAIASKKNPFAKPSPKPRPWWNMLGVFPEK